MALLPYQDGNLLQDYYIQDFNAAAQNVLNVENGGNFQISEDDLNFVLQQQPMSSQEFNSQEFNEMIADLPLADSTTANIRESTGPLPAANEYPGSYNFAFELDEKQAKKDKWAYSEKLNWLFIKQEIIVPILFRWNPAETGFIVRALPIYSDPQHMKEPVRRCYTHSSPGEASNKGFSHVYHIIRSDNPGADYQENEESERCSVIVPLGQPQAGTRTVTVTYKFMCQTTCSSQRGMARRPIMVLFTLERENGEVIGRQKLRVKICSCPKRDMQKAEENANNSHKEETEEKSRKRPLAERTATIPRKQIKRERGESSDGTYIMPPMEVKSRKLYRSLLKRNQEVLLRFSRSDLDPVTRDEALSLLANVDAQLQNS